MPSNNEICLMEAVELAGRVREGELSPVEVVDAVLERMEALEPRLHAFCTPTPNWPVKRRSAWRRRSPPAKRRVL